MTSSRWMIEAQGLCRTYRMGEAEVQALRGVDLCVGVGEFVALMGPSGSGKSTLLHLVGCLDTPTGGRLLLDGHDVGSLSSDEAAAQRNTRLGFMFQTFNLLPRLSSLENVALPLLYRGLEEGEARKRAVECLRRVGLEHRLAHRPSELSGGEQQRVAIARALITDPVLILADEPTGNLDSARGAEILRLLVETHAAGRTILMVTHDAQVASHAQRVVRMRDGRIVQEECGDVPA